MADWEEIFSGEYKKSKAPVTVQNPYTGEVKKFNTKEEAENYIKIQQKKHGKQKTTKPTEKEKKIEAQLKLGGGYYDPDTGFTTEDSLRAGGQYTPERFKAEDKDPDNKALSEITKLEKNIQELQRRPTELTPQKEAAIKLMKIELGKKYSNMGIDTTGMSAPSGDAAPDTGGFISKILSSMQSSRDRSKWIKNRTVELAAEYRSKQDQLPDEYKRGPYLYAKKQAIKEWEDQKTDPSTLTDEELIKRANQ